MQNKRRQLVFVWPYVEWGGSQIYCLAIIKHARSDWDITVILPEDSHSNILKFVSDLGANIKFINAGLDLKPAHGVKRKLQRHWSKIRAEWQSYATLREFDVKESVFHVDFAPWQSWIFYTALALRRANVVTTIHNFFSGLPKWREFIFWVRLQFLSLLPRFHILVANQDTKNKLKRWVESKFWKKIGVTYACVDPEAIRNLLDEKIDKKTIRETYGLKHDSFIVLTVGQFVDRKGRWVLLDAAKKALAIDHEIEFVWLMQSSPSEQDLKRLEAYGLHDRFRIVLSESVGSERFDVLRFIRAADIFALPSFVEGLPIALLEAMALGIPSISTNVYAIPEAIKNNETGILIEPGDSNSLVDKIVRLKNDTSFAKTLAESGSKYVMVNFDERITSGIAIETYKSFFRGADNGRKAEDHDD